MTVPIVSGCAATVTWPLPTATTFCGENAILSSSHSPGQSFPLGTTVVQYVATDGYGNTDTCSFEVEVVDETPPAISCPSNSFLPVQANCKVALPDYTGTAFPFDNCDGSDVEISQLPLPGTVLEGPGTEEIVTLTAIDAAGNQNSCQFTVTTVDETAPAAQTILDRDEYVNAACEFIIPDYSNLVVALDNCDDNLEITQSPTIGSTINGAGTVQTITLTVTDDSDNSTIREFNITLLDNIPPQITCTADIEENLIADCDFVLPDYTSLAVVSDNCDEDVVVTQSPEPNEILSGHGTVHVITLTATDDWGNESTCTFNLTLLDITPPEFTICPADFTENLDPNCDFVLPDYRNLATADDNCAVVSVAQVPAPGTPYSGHNTTIDITLTAMDQAGLTDDCTFTVTLNDVTPPEFNTAPTDHDVFVDEECEFLVPDYALSATASDACDANVSITQLSPPVNSLLAGHNTTQAITLRVIDDAGNFYDSTFTVALRDTLSPSFVMAPDDHDVYLDAGCQFALPDYTGEAVATDNCDNAVTITQSPIVGTLLTGHNSSLDVTLTATDDAGNFSRRQFTITAKDTISPTFDVTPVDHDVFLDSQCEFTIPDYTLDATAFDNCDAEVTITQFPIVGTVMTGHNSFVDLILTATDDIGNTALRKFTISLKDTISPEFTSTPPPQEDVWDGNQFIVPDYTGLVSIEDGCDDQDVVLSQTPEVGEVLLYSGGAQPTIVINATDKASNASSTSFVLDLVDVTPPVITNMPADIVVSANAACTATASWTAPTVTDAASGVASVVSDHFPNSSFPLDTTIVTYTATDHAGNVSQASFKVIVRDTTKPVFSCVQPAVVVNPQEDCYGVATWDPPIATDNCNVTITSTHEPGDEFPMGRTVVQYTASDAAGNQATCSFNVIVRDNLAPVIDGCPDEDIVVQVTSACGVVVNWVAPTATDNCTFTLDSNFQPGDTFFPGVTEIVYTATDTSGNSSVCSFHVIVEDNTPPVFNNCIEEVTAVADSLCQAVVSWTPPTATDLCSSFVDVVASHEPGSTFPQGTTTVVYTATDSAGNVATCGFNVVVQDELPPVFLSAPESITAVADDDCSASVSWVEPEIYDCDEVTLSTTHEPGAAFGLGETVVTYTAIDPAGNRTLHSFSVTVEDKTGPTFTECPSDIEVEATSGCEVPVSWTPPTATDNCDGNPDVMSTHMPGDVFRIGTTAVSYTASDEGGNTVTCSFNVIVADGTKPVISGCPNEDIVAEASASCGVVVTWDEPTATDNCRVAMTSTHNSGDTFEPGTTQVVYTATDSLGNVATCSFQVIVEDKTAPVFLDCVQPEIVVAADASCFATVNWTAPAVSDNCGNVTLTSTHEPGSAFPLGSTHVVYSATDQSGNSSTCSFKVIVNDVTGPAFVDCPASIAASADENCGAVVTWTVPEILDCSKTNITSTHQPGDWFPLGTTEVVYTATDSVGNESVCSFTVTVEDKMAPVFTGCHELITVDAGEACETTVSWTSPEVSDNCELQSFTSDHTSGQAFGIGDTEVVYTATDAYGNLSTCSFVVRVIQDALPVIEGCPENIFLKADETGMAIAEWTEPTASVICGSVDLNSTHSPGSWFEVGVTEVVYTAIDQSGKSETCSFLVEVDYDEVEFDVVPVLTPNGDGINDVWMLPNIEKFSENEVLIVDRWGGVVFKRAGYDNESIVWRGTNNSGVLLPTGTYFYTVKVKVGPDVVQRKGFIELVR